MKFIGILSIAFVSVFFGLTAQARLAHITKTFPFAPSNLQKVEQALQTAASRRGESMKEWAAYPIDAASTVRCPEESPIVYNGHLYGCALEFNVDLGGGATATLSKLLYLTQSYADVQTKLSQTDANTVERVDLASPFDGGNGSVYFCNAEGTQGSRTWSCYMTVVD